MILALSEPNYILCLMVSAFATTARLVLAQQRVDEKSIMLNNAKKSFKNVAIKALRKKAGWGNETLISILNQNF